jgi:hypothetical protein
MCIEEFGVYMLRKITFHIAHLNLCDTSCIVFINDCGCLLNIQPTCRLDMVDPSKPCTFTRGFIWCNNFWVVRWSRDQSLFWRLPWNCSSFTKKYISCLLFTWMRIWKLPRGRVNRQVETFSTKTRNKLGKTGSTGVKPGSTSLHEIN